jgi:hypothetical protein
LGTFRLSPCALMYTSNASGASKAPPPPRPLASLPAIGQNRRPPPRASSLTDLDTRDACNRFRLSSGEQRGHYESYFQRANHGTRPLAFWIRYTALVPRAHPEQAVGELWAIYFDGERNRTVAVKERHPFSACEFSDRRLAARIAGASLDGSALSGRAESAGHRIGWQLEYACAQPPLLLLPARLYEGGFPKAKSLVGAPGARYRGALEIDGESISIDGWQGSQNHNWGERHTDRYAWGQVAGFEGDDDVFLECASARMRIGPLWTPWITPLVLRLEGREHSLNALTTALRARARVHELDWRFESAGGGARIQGHIHAPRSSFVGLTYDDPTGRQKICLNTKIASCDLQVELPGEPRRHLRTQARAAFELLTDGETHGVPVAL